MGASDLHLKAGSPPAVRLATRLVVNHEFPALTPGELEELAMSIMAENQRSQFAKHHEADFAYSLPNVGRFRVNIFMQRGSIGMTLRQVATRRATVAELNLPPVITQLADEPRGLILVTGTAGSGKTTTLASMVDHINETRDGHIITIEDPIEVLHSDKRCIVNQREIGSDTESYAEALRRVVRQDPDAILIGEMRDLETVSAALSAAEIGKLVLSTLHTIDATETLNRIIDFFEPYQQQQVRLSLAASLKGVVSMRLIPAIGGGVVPAVEVMVTTGTIREYIVDPEKTHLIRDAIENGGYYGMQTFDQSLLALYNSGMIALDDAVSMAHNAHDFRIKVRKMVVAAHAAQMH